MIYKLLWSYRHIWLSYIQLDPNNVEAYYGKGYNNNCYILGVSHHRI